MSEPFIGEIRLLGFQFAPRGWAICDGRVLQIRENPELFALIGNTYGGDGRNTFALPDLCGRVPMGTGRGKNLTPRRMGDIIGEEKAKLPEPVLPAHTHDAGSLAIAPGSIKIKCNTDKANANDPKNNFPGQAGVAHKTYATEASEGAYLNAGAVEVSGTNITGMTDVAGEDECESMGDVKIVQPSLVMNYCIALQGIFPSRG